MTRDPSPGRRLARWWPALLLALAVAVAVAVVRARPSGTVILVRHAEKAAGGGDDPPLSPEGLARAERLAALLGERGGTPIAHLYASEVRRTQDTAAPLGRVLGLPVAVVPARDVAGLVARLKAVSREGTSVVVGHSNTVPMLVARLTDGRVAPALGDDDFGSVFVVHVAPLGPATVVRLRYLPCSAVAARAPARPRRPQLGRPPESIAGILTGCAPGPGAVCP